MAGRAEARLVSLVAMETVLTVAVAVRKSRAGRVVRATQEMTDRLAHH